MISFISMPTVIVHSIMQPNYLFLCHSALPFIEYIHASLPINIV